MAAALARYGLKITARSSNPFTTINTAHRRTSDYAALARRCSAAGEDVPACIVEWYAAWQAPRVGDPPAPRRRD